METLRRALLSTFLVSLFLLAGVGIGLQEAGSSLVTFNFAGTVTFVGANLTGTFTPGQALSGSYTFNSATPDLAPADPTIGVYAGALTAFNFTLGAYTGTLAAGTNSILVEDNFSGAVDEYIVNAPFSGADVAGFAPLSFSLDLADATQTAFSSDALPTTPPNLSRFTSNDFLVRFVDGGDCGPPPRPTASPCTAFGTLTSLTVATPEPGALALLGAGLAGLAGRACRRGKRQ